MKGQELVLGVMLALTCGEAPAEVVATARSPEGIFPEFRVVLDAVGVPVAVANFMGLADGSQRWVDPENGGTRGGVADAFYDGMVFDWHAGSLLRGGLRMTEGEYKGRTGYTVIGKAAHAWDEVSEGTLLWVEDGGPHSGGGEVALALTNGLTGWTVLGRTKPGDEAGVRGLAAAVAAGATEVRWTVDTAGATPEERTALEQARGNLPLARGITTRFEGAQLAWALGEKCQLGIARTANSAEGWQYQGGAWNEGEAPIGFVAGWADLGLAGDKGFASFSEVEYPAMTGWNCQGKWQIEVFHTGQEIQYWMDFGGMTGMWATVESGKITDAGTLDIWYVWRETGNSVYVSFGMGELINEYYFGFAEKGGGEGRFMSRQSYTADTVDWGSFKLTEGWKGDAEKVTKRLRRRGKSEFPKLGGPAQ